MGVIATATGLVAERQDAHARAEADRNAHDHFARVARAAASTPLAIVAMLGDGALLLTGSADACGGDSSVHGRATTALTLCDMAVAGAAPLVVGDVRADVPGTDGSIGAFLGVPVVLGEDVIGVCCAIEDRPRAFGPAEIEALSDLAALLATDVRLGRERRQRDRQERWERDQRAVLEAIASGRPLHETLDLLLTQLEAYSDELLCSVLLLDDDGLHLRHASAPRLPAAYSAAIDGAPIGPAVGSCGTAAHRGEQVIVEDIANDPLWADYADLAVGFGLAACWSTPILGADGTVLGTFAIYYGEPRSPDPEDLDLVAQVSALASIAIVRARDEAALRASAEEASARAAEHAALSRVATAVAVDVSPEALFALVAREAVQLTGADGGAVIRFLEDDRVVLTGTWRRDGISMPKVGVPHAVSELDLSYAVRDAQAAVRLEGDSAHARPHLLGAPIRLGEGLWGTLGLGAADRAFSADDERRLTAFADLVATALANAAAQTRLAELASTDPLTGLANHRVFQERLRGTVAGALRRGDNAALVVFDVDGFKGVNDGFGHQEGDRVLTDLAAILGPHAREGDLVARLGGDEFALLLPGADAFEATAAAERIRALVSAAELGSGGHHLTLSAGACDLLGAHDADELMRHADSALYWAKAHGRDLACSHSVAMADGLSARDRAMRLTQSQTRMGIRALARAIDARDPMTVRHSERVAVLSVLLAQAAGWTPERVAQLREAALVHDVGKVGVPDEILSKPGALDEREMAAVREHAALGAQIAADALTEEQTMWIRSHHERPDGTGYPDGLRGAELSEGTQLLALADAWDAMTSDRTYRSARGLEDALYECRALVGSQFTPWAVAMLARVHAQGLLAHA